MTVEMQMLANGQLLIIIIVLSVIILATLGVDDM